MVDAAYAHQFAESVLADKNRPDYIWSVLNERIEQAMCRGKFNVEFSETFDLRFKEHRKEVKRKLEELGYKVKYRRFVIGDRDYQIYLNQYFISW